ncbi:MAG: hypothetical protein IJU23_10500 [Proteobacteria bacterium]|nr:hypothetical protein [Pseudomonadota bacterium]
MNRMLRKCLYTVCAGLCSLTLCSQAFADDCQKLAKIEAWTTGIKELTEQMNQQQWKEALKTAEGMSNICDRSPTLNYAMGKIYKELGNDSKALFYYQKATLFTEEFAVKGKTLEKMWFDRYEAEHPEARPEAIEALKKENEELKAQAQQMHEKEMESRVGLQADIMQVKNRYGAGMWTGVAVAGIGIALTAAGTYMVIDNKDPIEFIKGAEAGDTDYQVKSMYGVGWTLLGAGVASVIAGTIVTGIMGYYYTHTEGVEPPVSFHFSPVGADLSIKF